MPPPAQGSRIDDPGKQRLKSVADALLELWRRHDFDLVILGSPRELQSALINQLHTSLQDILIIDEQLEPGTPLKQVLAKVMIGETQSRVVRESVLIYRLLDAVKAGGMGVVGIPATLRALNSGTARMLLLREGLAKLGKACRRCGALALSGKRCSFCSGETEPALNILAEMAQSALDQRCQVFRILHDRRLDTMGGVGAELRFKDEGRPG
jgi:peptide subunit release factor 1 (eRF1)